MPEAPTFSINGRRIGPCFPPYIVAEMSGNHKGEKNRALELITAAHEAGADAVKIQTYRPDTITIDYDGPGFMIESGLWDGKRLYSLYEEAYTPWEWHPALFDHARSLGITIFSSPFDKTAVDLLENLGAPAYKIASFELVDIPLISYVASTGKPMILSTGLANLGEIDDAVTAIRNVGDNPILLLHCTSGYPTPAEECDLRTIPHLAAAFGTAAGLSDHSEGLAVPIASVALGAAIIEKHFTLARADGGVDSSFSLEKKELQELVRETKRAFAALGSIDYQVKASEGRGREFRRSLYVVADIGEGQMLDEHNIRSIRPGFGISPKYLPKVLGQRAIRDLKRGTPLDWSMIGHLQK